jgi:hypothetical protein
MGSRGFSAFAVVIAVASTPIAWSSPTVQRRGALDGTWEYQMPDRRGTATFDNGQYVLFFVRTDSMPPAGALSDSSRAAIHRRMNAEAGTFTVADTLVTMQRRHHKDPRSTATTWRWSFVLKGDTLFFHVLNAEGKSAGMEYRSIRMK